MLEEYYKKISKKIKSAILKKLEKLCKTFLNKHIYQKSWDNFIHCVRLESLRKTLSFKAKP